MEIPDKGMKNMNPLFRMPIKLQLIMIVLIVALPAAAIIIYSGVQQRNHAINEARIDAQRLVDRIASEQRILVASALQLVVSVSQLPDVTAKDAGKVNPFLSQLLKLHPKLSILFIADHTGNVWASADHLTDTVTIYDRRYFKNAIASGQLASGEFHISRIQKKPIFTFGYPYKNRNGDIVGVVGAGIFLDDYKYILEQTRLPIQSNIILLDHKGSVLFSAINSDKYIGKMYSKLSFKKLLEGPDNNSLIDADSTDKLSQNECFVYYQRLRLEGELSPYMYVRVGIPVESTLSQANREIGRNMSMFAMVLALALFVSWIVGKRSIVDRIVILKTASRNLAKGDLRIRVSDLVKGGELGELGELFDVMAQQLALREKNLSDSQQFLNTIVDTEPDCVKILDTDGRVLMMNPAGLEIIGAESLEQVKGQSIFPLISTEHRDAFIKLTHNVFKGLSGRLEFEADCFNGRHVWLGTHVVPLRDDAGEIVSLLGITRDITDRKLAEEALADKQLQLQDLNVTLEKRIEDAVTDSRKKDQILIQQSRQAAMGEMISNIAHQWRQPLNTLALIVQEIQMTYGRVEFSKERLDASVDNAMGLINNMSKTIDYFRNFFKPDKEKRVFKVNQVIDKTLTLIEPSLKNLEINIEVVASDDTDINGYENEYCQVLLNIIINSKDAFGVCNIDTHCIITINAYKDNNKSVVTIADNAGGIADEIIDKIFDPYFTTKGPDKGTGIGLYMAKTIIEKNMGGRLTVRNTADGAEFRIEV